MSPQNQPHFFGRHYHALEQKGRLSIPKSFREQLSDTAILTQGLEKSLFLFHAQNWQEQIRQLEDKPFTKKAARDWIRLLANTAVEVSFDSVGRILIPDHLKAYAKLDKRIVVVGSMSRVEIWDQSIYHEYFEKLQESAESIAEAVSKDTGSHS